VADGKVLPGDDFHPPAAPIWNNMIDAGTAWANSRLNKPATDPIRPRETDIIKAKNNSGAVRRLGEILRISGKALDTVTDENKWLLGVEPTDDGYFGILKEPAAISGIASLQVSGCCMALVNVTDADHKRAASADGEYVLQSSDDGPIEILFAPDGTGEKNCVVRFAGGDEFREAVLGADMAAPSSSLAAMTSCTMYFIKPASTAFELNPTSFLGHNHDPDLTGERGTYCRVQKMRGIWVVYYLGCSVQSALVTALDELEE